MKAWKFSFTNIHHQEIDDVTIHLDSAMRFDANPVEGQFLTDAELEAIERKWFDIGIASTGCGRGALPGEFEEYKKLENKRKQEQEG